jgi:uncharacterized repeat protein (TIGR03806 family)
MINKVRHVWTASLLTLAAFTALGACSSQEPKNAQSVGPNLETILAEGPADFLADYHLFADDAAHVPAARVEKYELTNPLFSDYALKERFVFIPEGEVATYHDTRALDFPVGTVLAKTFSYAPDLRTPEVDTYKIETRVLIHKASGWVAYPYIWNEAQNEARYAPVGGRREVSFIDPSGTDMSFTYGVPNANQCKTCHQSGHAIKPIGPKGRNLNTVLENGKPQLDDWVAKGMLHELPSEVSSVAAIEDLAAPLNDRARAYLDINCAHCHKPDGSASNSGLFLDYSQKEPVRFGINKHPTAAGRGAGNLKVVIDPGSPATSILYYRMANNEAGIAMPELGRSVTHKEGVDLIEQWINSLPKQ